VDRNGAFQEHRADMKFGGKRFVQPKKCLVWHNDAYFEHRRIIMDSSLPINMNCSYFENEQSHTTL